MTVDLRSSSARQTRLDKLDAAQGDRNLSLPQAGRASDRVPFDLPLIDFPGAWPFGVLLDGEPVIEVTAFQCGDPGYVVTLIHQGRTFRTRVTGPDEILVQAIQVGRVTVQARQQNHGGGFSRDGQRDHG